MLSKLICKLFGHEWKTFSTTRDKNGMIIIDEIKCTRCNETKKIKTKN